MALLQYTWLKITWPLGGSSRVHTDDNWKGPRRGKGRQWGVGGTVRCVSQQPSFWIKSPKESTPGVFLHFLGHACLASLPECCWSQLSLPGEAELQKRQQVSVSSPCSTIAASAGRLCAASAAPSAPPSLWWALSLKWESATAATRPSQMKSKFQQSAELSGLRRGCDLRAAPSTAAMTKSVLVPAGLEYRPWQVGKALLSTKRLFSCETGEEEGCAKNSSVLFSIPGACVLQMDVLRAYPSVCSFPWVAQECRNQGSLLAQAGILVEAEQAHGLHGFHFPGRAKPLYLRGKYYQLPSYSVLLVGLAQ